VEKLIALGVSPADYSPMPNLGLITFSVSCFDLTTALLLLELTARFFFADPMVLAANLGHVEAFEALLKGECGLLCSKLLSLFSRRCFALWVLSRSLLHLRPMVCRRRPDLEREPARG
jgi:hypothetical protein